jgi:predicted Zn-dependent protease
MNRFHFLSRTGLVISLALSLGACSTTTQKGAVGIEREQMLLVSQNEMTEGAKQAYADVLKKAEKDGQLNTDPKRVAQLRTIADRLIPHTKIYRDDAPDWNWEVNYIDSDQLNAWCMPGGKIAFYSGIIDTLELSEDEIAAIMGHEMAHALREHGRERASQAMLGQVGLAALQILGGVKGAALDASNMVVQTTFILPNSRTHETEADRMGVELAARAGFDPYGAVRVWEKMLKLSKDAPPEFLSTHPAHESRIKDLKKYAKRVMPLYEKAKPSPASD